MLVGTTASELGRCETASLVRESSGETGSSGFISWEAPARPGRDWPPRLLLLPSLPSWWVQTYIPGGKYALLLASCASDSLSVVRNWRLTCLLLTLRSGLLSDVEARDRFGVRGLLARYYWHHVTSGNRFVWEIINHL